MLGKSSHHFRGFSISVDRSESLAPSSTALQPREVAIFHKAISGVCIDPLFPQTLATYTEVSLSMESEQANTLLYIH